LDNAPAFPALFYQLQDPNFSKGVLWVIMWFAAGCAYFALHDAIA
jgi:ethanolamine permease